MSLRGGGLCAQHADVLACSRSLVGDPRGVSSGGLGVWRAGKRNRSCQAVGGPVPGVMNRVGACWGAGHRSPVCSALVVLICQGAC